MTAPDFLWLSIRQTCFISSSVVDPDLLVHGLNNVRVVDASVMPEIVSGNTNAAVVMIAEKGSDLVKKKWIDSGSGNDEIRQKDEL